MLLLGVLQAQAAGAGPAGAGSFDLLETQVLASSASSVTFSSLAATYGADYQHLQLRLTTRTDRVNPIDNMRLNFNGDTGSNYRHHWLLGDGGSVTSSTIASTNIELYRSAAATATSGIFGANVVDILDPFSSNKNTVIRNFAGITTAANEVRLQSGLWVNTAALTTITISSGWNFVTGSRFSLYGWKAA